MLGFKRRDKKASDKVMELFHSNAKIFENMKIQLNGKNISDVITKKGEIWINLMTLKSSYNINHVLRKNRRFQIIAYSKAPLYFPGLYVIARKDLDALIMVRAHLDYEEDKNKPAKWVEEARTYVSISHPCFERGPLEQREGFSVYQRIENIEQCKFDICGQAVLVDADHYDNFFAGAREEALKFFGEYPTHNKACYALDVGYHMIDFKTAYSFGCLYDACFKKSDNFAPRVACPNYTKDEAPPYLPLSSDASAKLKTIFKKHFDNNVRHFDFNILKFIYTGVDNCFAYIQKDGDTAVYRCFFVEYDFKFKKCDTVTDLADSFINETEITFNEYKRVYIYKDDSNMTEQEYYHIWDNLDIVPVLMDDLTGTALEYTSRYIKEWIDYFTLFLHDPSRLGSYDKTISSIIDFFVSANHLPFKYVRYCTSMAYQMAKRPVIEMLLNLDIKNPSHPDVDYTKRLKNKMIRTWLDRSLLCDGDKMINLIFGEVDNEQKSLHKILGLPKGMLECILISGIEIIPTIQNLKAIFSATPESKQYFLRMCESKCEELIRIFCDMEEYFTSDLFEGFKILIKIFGPSNCEKYLAYLKKTRDEQYFYVYFSFLEKIDVIGPSTKNIGWKFNNLEEVKQVNEQLHSAYMLALNETKYKEAYERFKEFYPKWERYLYENTKYLITYPKKPIDLVEEGINLHHCVKQFIEYVANGDTTILFIRKKKKPNKSFYTLEICNGAIRQCHGHSNNNVTKELEDFLREYCKVKGLTYSSGKELCGPQ